MIFGKRRHHRLPKFPAAVRGHFRSMCGPLTAEQVHELKTMVGNHVMSLRERANEQGDVDVQSAEDLSEVCYFLLDNFESYSPANQKLVAGAVRYFAVGDDAFDDRIFASGFDDDKRVMNYVLEELEINDKYFPF